MYGLIRYIIYYNFKTKILNIILQIIDGSGLEFFKKLREIFYYEIFNVIHISNK